MAKKRHSAEQVVRKLREAELGAGAFPGDAFRFRDGVELEAATQVVCEHVQLLPGAIGGIAFGRHHIGVKPILS